MRKIAILILISFLCPSCVKYEEFVDSYKRISASSELVRKLTPRAARYRIYDNHPTHYNQEEYANETRRSASWGDFFAMRDPEEFQKDYASIANKEYGDPYGQGFSDGCDTAASAVGAGTIRLMRPKINAHRLAYDAWYLRGFQDASTVCTFRNDWELH